MAALGAQTVAASYEQLLHVDTDGGGNGNNLLSIKDGDNGTTFGLKLATNKVEVIPGSDDANAFEVSQADGTAVFTVDTSTPSATFTSDVFIAENIKHTGDTDTRIRMLNDNVIIYAGNENQVDIGNVITVFNEGGGDNDLRIESENNANMFYVDASTDRIGIGTASPARTLDVVGDIQASSLIKSSVSSNSTNLATANGGTLILENSHDTDGNFSNIGGYNTNGLVASQINFVNVSQSSRHGAITLNTHNGTSLTERVRVDKDGNVGIGTASPDSCLLHVHSASAGTVSPNAAADELVLENSGAVGMTMLAGTSSTCTIAMGDSGSEYQGVIIYDNNDNSMKFKTLNSEAMRILSDGRVTIKSTSLPADFGGARGHLCISSTDDAGANNYAVLQLQGHTINNDGSLGAIHFYDHTSSNCSIQANRQNNSGSGKLMFATSESGGSKVTRLTIYDSGVSELIANGGSAYAWNVQNDGNDTDRYGMHILCGKDDGSGTNTAIRFSDGDSTEVGKITFSGGTVTYGAFTAHHPCSIPDADNNSESSENAYPYGTLLETTSLSYTQKNGADTERGIRYNVRKSQSANSKKVLGAYGSCMNGTELDSEGNLMAQTENLHQALVLGDGHIICNNEGGNIKIGDGICTSSTEGIGMKATTNPSMVIGIAQEDVSFSGSETKLVAVQYGLQQFTPW